MPDYINVSDDLKNKDSKVRISDEVIAAIAGVAASQVEGVATMSGNIVGDISSAILGKKNKGRGVKVSSGEKEVSLICTLTSGMAPGSPKWRTKSRRMSRSP